jgi:hypothetical protein
MRFFYVSVLFLLVCVANSCQQYSSGLQQGAARADETSAIATLRTIAQAQMTYNVTNSGRYATFEQLAESGLLDARFNRSHPEFHGYTFTINVSPSDLGASTYSCNADPAPTSPHGGRHFYMDGESRDIRVNPTQQATKKDEIYRP